MISAILKYLPYVIIVVLAILLLRSCNKTQRLSENNEVLKEKVTVFKLKNGQLATSKGVLEVTERELRKQLFIKDDSLAALVKAHKKVKISYIIKTFTKFDSIFVPYDSAIPFAFSKKFARETAHYSIWGTSNQFGLEIEGLTFQNTQRLVTGVKRGFFNDKLTTSVTNSNPHIETTEIITQETSVRRKRFGLGVFAGFDIKLEPIYGVGGSYQFIQF